jgi:hypothetical protein
MFRAGVLRGCYFLMKTPMRYSHISRGGPYPEGVRVCYGSVYGLWHLRIVLGFHDFDAYALLCFFHARNKKSVALENLGDYLSGFAL